MAASEPVDVLGGDETFIAVPASALAPLVTAAAADRKWWPDLELRVTRDRGPKGCQWVVAGAAGGTAEVWLEPWQDGTVVHLYLRLRVVPDRRGRVRPGSGARELAWRHWITEVKDRLDADRGVGEPVAFGAGEPTAP